MAWREKAYNWALHEWQRQYALDKAYRDACLAAGVEVDTKNLNKPSQAKLRRELNAIKRELFPLYAGSDQMRSAGGNHAVG
ncbi:hypothetical protein [Psychrobacter sp. KH172YL61]|uniref:hypothetical protein n=1 Tax=Psychrobacter sp. KH172YL61 TaxID=2517899 RepID=UPI001F07C013|nr:hypothetical protein [Psychrobacter sp. KH172YL61]